MHRTGRLLVALLAVGVVACLVGGCGGGDSLGPTEVGTASVAPQGQDQLVRRIVVLDEDVFVNEAAREALLAQFGEVISKPLRLVNGVAVLLPPTAEAALREEAGVLRIDVDAEVHALPKPPGTPGKGPGNGDEGPEPSETLPWGVDRIDAEWAWSASTGAGVNIAVVDTGIDKDHPDLTVAGGVNCGRGPAKKWDDDNGHGTHVAGTIAALDNEIGVVGVAPEASLWAVKVLDRNGSGYVSDVIEGLDWCVDNGMQVVNISLGTNSDIQSLHDACDAAAVGLLLVAAAGNDGAAVDYPAAYGSVIAVAAVDSTDTRPDWSSYGDAIELAAPGVDIYSTWKGGGYETHSGTSMSAPHVSGTLALNLSADLGATTDDLPPEGWDQYTGWGLVDAEHAATGLETGDDLP